MSHLLSWLLNFAYVALLLFCAPWIVWTAVRKGKYREGLAAKLLGNVPERQGDRPCVWIHAVSVGEGNLLGTTINQIRQRLPACDIVVSTTTKTGYELATRKHADLSVFYCPLDFSWAVSRAMRRVRPTLLVLAELELWPNLIAAAMHHGAKVAIINGRLSDNSFRGYRRIRPLVAHVLRQIDVIAAQNGETAERCLALGARNVQVTGSLKYEGAEVDRHNAKTQALGQLAGIDDEDVVWIAGSTQAPEEQMVLKSYQRLSV